MFWLLLLVLPCHASDAEETYGSIEAKRQHVRLTLTPGEPTYTGRTSILFEQSRPVEEVTVHAADMEITHVAFARGDRRWEATFEEAENETVVIRPTKPIKVEGLKIARPKKAAKGGDLYATPSWFTVEIEFTNDFNTQPYGLYGFEHEGQHFLATQFEADDAREAFPCIDEPSSKLSLWLELDVPTDLVALGNAPVVDVQEAEDRKLVVFGPTPPIPTYAMALAVGPYVSTDIPGVALRHPARFWTVPGRSELSQSMVDKIGPLLDTLETWFGSPYPFDKLELLAIPEFAFGGMENPGLILLTDQLLAEPDQITPRQERRVIEVAAHELAHMWFGNLVTLEWWDDFWLNESFAEWMGNRMGEVVYDREGFQFTRIGGAQGALSSDARGTMRPVRTEIDPQRIFETTNFLAYPKGEALLSMTEIWLGPDVFQAGVRAYIEAHREGNASAEDLFQALSAASGEDVGAMLLPWLDRPGGPLVRFTREGGELQWTQERFLSVGAEAERAVHWTVPLRVRWADDAGVHDELLVLQGAEGAASLPVEGEVQWFLPVADGVGYLAWSLSEDDLRALIEAGDALTGPERYAVVGNLELLTQAGEIPAGQLLQLLEGFSAEAHPRVMRAVLSAQAFAEDAVTDEMKPAWATYVQKTRGPWLERLGMAPVEGEDPEIPGLRSRLMNSLLDEADDPAVLAHALSLAEQFLADPASTHPAAGRFGLFARAERAEPEFQDQMLQRWKDTANPNLRGTWLSAYALVPGEAQRARALELALGDEVSLQEMFTLINAAFDEDEEADDALDWTIAHYDELKARVPPHFLPGMVYVGGGCDLERWERTLAFFEPKIEEVPGFARTIKEGSEGVQLCVARRAAHGESVSAYLAALVEADEAGDTP